MSATSSALSRSRDDARVIENFLDRHRQRAVRPLDHHRHAIADQERVDAGLVEDAREWGVVGGQHRDRRSGRLHRSQIGDANFLLLIQIPAPLKKSGPPRTGDPEHRSTLLPSSERRTKRERSSLRVPVQITDPSASPSYFVARHRAHAIHVHNLLISYTNATPSFL